MCVLAKQGVVQLLHLHIREPARDRERQQQGLAVSTLLRCPTCGDRERVAGPQRGVALLPDLHVSDSSEAMLSGRKPPFRLLVRAAATDGRAVNIRHAVSEGFVVRQPAHRTCGLLRATSPLQELKHPRDAG